MVSNSEDKPPRKRMARSKKKIDCNECSEVFSRKTDLLQHKREEHSVRRQNVCHLCNKAFGSKKRLKMHSHFHNVGGEYECFYCYKQFNKAWKMKIHLVNHSGRASYICQYCGDDFLYPGKILNHLKRIHDVWFACKDCGQAYPGSLDIHKYKCKIYGCKDCTLAFASCSELATHVKVHMNNNVQLMTILSATSSILPLADEPQLEKPKNDSQTDQPNDDSQLDEPKAELFFSELNSYSQLDEPKAELFFNELNSDSQLDEPKAELFFNELNSDSQLDEFKDELQLDEFKDESQFNEFNNDSQLDELNIDSQLDKPNNDSQLHKPNNDSQLDKPNNDSQLDKPKAESQLDEVNNDSQLDEPKDDSQLDKSKNLQSTNSERKVVKFYDRCSFKRPSSIAQTNRCHNVKSSYDLQANKDTENDATQDLVIVENISDTPMLKSFNDKIANKINDIADQIIDIADIDDKIANITDNTIGDKVANESDVSVTKGSELQLREISHPISTSVNVNCKEVDQLSFSPIFLKSVSEGSWGNFKVPETTINKRKRCENPFQKLIWRRNEEIHLSARKKEQFSNKLQLCVDSNAKLKQRNNVSFESWLVNDALSSTDRDFVFGIEASGSGHQQGYPHHCSNRNIKKEKSDMTFEDLCLF